MCVNAGGVCACVSPSAHMSDIVVGVAQNGEIRQDAGWGIKLAHWMFGFQRNGQEWIIRQMELANRLSYAAIDDLLFPGVVSVSYSTVSRCVHGLKTVIDPVSWGSEVSKPPSFLFLVWCVSNHHDSCFRSSECPWPSCSPVLYI